MIKSILSKKIAIREGAKHKIGMFAIENIKIGEVVFIKGGHILRREEVFSTGVINSYHPIDDEFYLGATNEHEEDKIKLFVNHSCNPNCGIRGEITFIAMRNIDIGEELTIDYGFLDNEDYSFECTCGEKECRKIITGRDWRLEELQIKYFEYFATYLKYKIKNK